MVSLIGIPPTALFWAKVYIFSAAVQSDLTWLAVLGVINSVISAYFYLRVVRVMYLQQPLSQERVVASIPVGAAVAITAFGVLFFGVLPTFLLRAANAAVLGTF
jgi:NADH-quinone oxidoreductase subunit N